MLSEGDMEDAIAENPEKYLDEEGLNLLKRQPIFGKYRFDLLFENRHGIKLIVEIQTGTLDRKHRDKILDYQYEYKKRNLKDFVDIIMVIANKIPSESREILRYRGIDFKEVREADFPIKESIENKPTPIYKTTTEDFDLPPETPCSLYTSGANSAVFKGFSKSSTADFKHPQNISDSWNRKVLNDVDEWLRKEYINSLSIGKLIKVGDTARASRSIGKIKPKGNSDGVRYLLGELGSEGILEFPDNRHFVVCKRIG